MEVDNNYKKEVLKRKIKALEWQRNRLLILKEMGLILLILSIIISFLGFVTKNEICFISGMLLILVSYEIKNGIRNKFETGIFWNVSLEKRNGRYQEPSWNEQLRIIENELNNSNKELNELNHQKEE